MGESNLTERPIKAFPGIGEKRAAAFYKLGVKTGGDLLRHFPRAYQNRGAVKTLNEVRDGEICSVIATVGTAPKTVMLRSHKSFSKFVIFDGTGKATVTFFNQNYLRDVFHVGEEFRFFTKIKLNGTKVEMTSPQFEPVRMGHPLPDYVPIYGLAAGLTQKMVANTVALALNELDETPVPELLPDSFRKEKGLPTVRDAYRMIHRPDTAEDADTGKRYFMTEALYLFSLGIALTRETRRKKTGILMKPYPLNDFTRALPFALTDAQERCVKEIFADLTGGSGLLMSRMVSGDVGSGKTAVAAAAIWLTVKNGYQAELMVPTGILASQHYDDLAPLFASFGIRTALLTGATTAGEKRKIKAGFLSGEIDVLIGTHALLTEDVIPKHLGLAVTDEQHRFGVAQRASLAERAGEMPHLLVMSATPIPRTLALTLYGDLDVSLLDSMPPGRQKVDTFVVDESYRERLNAFIRKNVNAGGQVYIVCPAVEETEEDPDELWQGGEIVDFFSFAEMPEKKKKRKSAIRFAEEMSAAFPEFHVAYLHGKMKQSEKDEIMRRFADGEIQILVSTTVIEVGVNVPNACLMIVENAEFFGLSQLHQLRGRVGRGTRKSYCILVSDAETENAKKRLDIMRSSNSGFVIAEEDLKLRGPGDFFPVGDGSARQSGEFRMGLMSLCDDMDLLREAAAAAGETVAADPGLTSPENRVRAEAVRALFALNAESMN